MYFGDTPEEAEFRQEVRSFIQINAPTGRISAADLFAGEVASVQDWLDALAEKGWLTPSWPGEYGGAGLSIMKQVVLNEEIARARISPPTHQIIGLGVVGPTLIGLGTKEQKAKYLPGIVSGEDIWCQGYSEPGAGSDLASITTKAVRDGDSWVVNGQKIYTTLAHKSRRCLLLARTNPEVAKHRGLTCFIVDMRAPGVSVRALINMTNLEEFNEIFFDNVRVHGEDILGEVDQGWSAALFSLDQERSAIGNPTALIHEVEDLVNLARDCAGGHNASQTVDRLLRCELADRLVEAHIARMFSYRVASLQVRGLDTNTAASISKLYGAELHQRIAQTGMKVMGLYGQLLEGSARVLDGGGVAFGVGRSPAYTIEGGTSEVQRTIIATRGLGLPRA